jgi:hypothetical protein
MPAGTLSAISGTNIRVVNVGALQVAEHKRPLDELSHNTYSASFKWTAPAAGSGTVTFFGVLNATGGDAHKTTDNNNNNNNNNDDNDDDLGNTFPNAAPNLVLTEGAPNAVPDMDIAPVIRCYPDPFTTSFTLEIQNMTGLYEMMICDMNGKVMHRETVMSLADNKMQVHASHLPAGRYQLRVINNGVVIVQPIVKL